MIQKTCNTRPSCLTSDSVSFTNAHNLLTCAKLIINRQTDDGIGESQLETYVYMNQHSSCDNSNRYSIMQSNVMTSIRIIHYVWWTVGGLINHFIWAANVDTVCGEKPPPHPEQKEANDYKPSFHQSCVQFAIVVSQLVRKYSLH
uniref:Uncharacterized protein n=1 Tax=Glossina brevipalpis TaxID=37001 RepID=A0A1A9WHF3_9MUSC